ncbi:MAG: hypothetical protein ABI333_07420 [bacterium]
MRRLWLLVIPLLGCQTGTSLPDRSDPRRQVRLDTPLHEIHQVYRIAGVVRAQKVGAPREVTVKGDLIAGEVILQRTRWDLLYMGQSAAHGLGLRAKYMKLPEPERSKHLRRVDNFVQVWWVPLADAPAVGSELKRYLKPTPRYHEQHRELAFVGRDSRFAWYLYAPIRDWVRVQRELSLGGGDSAFAGLIRGLGVKDRHGSTALGCHWLLGDAGPAAIGALEKVIADKHPQRRDAIRAVGRHSSGAMTAWLMRLTAAPDKEVSGAARAVLLHPARKEARALYVRWLDEGAGKRWVREELSACAAVDARAAMPILSRILASPHRIYEYQQAFQLSRRWAGRPIAQSLLRAAETIRRAGFSIGRREPDRSKLAEGAKVLLGSPDGEAAAVLALSLAVFMSKGNYEATRRTGVEILRKLRGRRGERLVSHLAKTCRHIGDQQAAQRLVAELRSP